MWQIRGKKESLRNNWPSQTAFAVLVTLQTVFAYFFWLAYGTMAFIIGPLRTWSTILSILLWYQAAYLPDHCLR